MNKPIGRLFVVALLMFGALLVSTSWWTVLRADDLDKNPDNRRALIREQKIRRGTIFAADGSAIARSTRDEEGVYHRAYPQGKRFGHPVGYSYASLGQTEVEKYRNDELSGNKNAITTTFDQLIGHKREGDDVRTALDPKAQQLALDGIAKVGSSGAAVALDPRTGAVKVMASTPTYDPNTITDKGAFSAASTDNEHKPLVNRAVQFGAAPGSTFKVVTATAAIDTGQFSPGSMVDGDSGQKFASRPLANDFNENFGPVDLKTALAKSVNTAFANVGTKLGASTMKEYMERFGFDRKPQLDYPRDEMSASVVAPSPPGHAVSPTSKYVDLGRLSIGQGGLQATPLQMAEVAAAVANDGKLMKPHIATRVVDRDGRTVDTIEPSVQSDVMKSSTAAAVTDMMVGVVQNGTGTNAQLPGIQVAGKTGTAETEFGKKINDVWFIGFAPAENPRIAVAVTVKAVTGFGGDFAAPIARDIMQELLK
ncbi:Penicillin-binding protein A [Baekduia alba]|uniref:peptidoglycan D,D-transpeptidase FtsI family protein n=1 Tax=Baekduia alba TaxID=2997333 RepID=UPI002341B6CF|nr:penicillin-binding protein 2 [Baekduia alba]WCB91345.1 Penicillin-binding protein A [Baekduia alba]